MTTCLEKPGRRMVRRWIPLALAVFVSSLAGCMRGGASELPPVHLVLDMDFQPKLKAQGKTAFAGWSDHRNMRAPVADAGGKTAVVARGSLPNADHANKDANGFVTKNPVAISAAVLARGQDRFNIHCSVCHGYSGQGGIGPTGNGLVGRRWSEGAPIPTFHYQEGKDAVANRVALLPDGEYFEVITFGKGTMPAYGARLSTEDRWAIVWYVRALQQLSK